MSDQKNQKGGQRYSVDDILAEYGSGRYRGTKVLDFPEQEDPPARGSSEESEPTLVFPTVLEKKTPPKASAQAKPIPEIVPENVGRKLGAQLHTLLRKADHFADHMYDQAEPDEAVQRAEKYIPGVDKEVVAEDEDDPRPSRRPKLRLVRKKELPPDTPPRRLAAQYAKGLKGQGRRVRLALLLGAAAAILSVDLPLLPWSMLTTTVEAFGLTVYQCRALAATVLLLLTGAVCYEIPAAGAKQLFTAHPRAECILFLAWAFTLLDGFTAGYLGPRGGCLPYSAVTALGLAFALQGTNARRCGDRLSAKAASQARSPYVVTLDETLWSNKPTYTKASGSSVGFGSQLQMEDGGQRAYRYAAPLLLLGSLLCTLLSSVGQGAPGRFLWAASACFTAAGSWSALLAFGLPYRKLAERLHQAGAALVGWTGAARCGHGGVIVSDVDLFPTGSVAVAQVKVFGSAATEKVVGYTASMLRAMDCGTTRTFHDLLRTQGSMYREVSDLEWHEGGASGVIRNKEVLVGTAAYMHRWRWRCPPDTTLKTRCSAPLTGSFPGCFCCTTP